MGKLSIIIIFSFFYSVAFAQKSNKDSIDAVASYNEAKSLFLSDRSSSLNKCLLALEIAKKNHYKILEINTNNLTGIIYTYDGKYDLSLDFLNRAMVIAQELQDKALIAKVFTNIGLNYMQQGNQLKAIDASLKAAKILEGINILQGLGNVYANISSSYYNIKMEDKALIYADSALKYFKIENKTTGIANIYNTYGVIYSDKKLFTKSLFYYSKSLKIKQAINDINGQANALTNMGSLYSDLKSYKKALEMLNKAKVLFKQANDPKGLVQVAYDLANLKESQNDNSALLDTKNAYNFASKNTTVAQQRELALSLSQKYSKQKDFENSLKYYKIYNKLKDSTLNTVMLKQITDLEAHYQSNKKQHQIALLDEKNKVQQLEITKRNTTIGVICVIFILFVIISYQFYIRYKLKQEGRLKEEVISQQTLASKGIIEAEERERKRIAGELHDGIGQLFTAVKMNMEILVERFLIQKPDAHQLAEKTMALVDESCIEVRSIAHQMMPNALIKSGLLSALRDFINKIPADKLKISLEAKGIDKQLEGTTETVLYRVIQESVNNVIKHSDASVLNIILLCDEKEITVSIEDNGKGFNSTDQSKFTGIGLKNMVGRVAYLKGSVDITSSPGNGTLVAIFIPLI